MNGAGEPYHIVCEAYRIGGTEPFCTKIMDETITIREIVVI